MAPAEGFQEKQHGGENPTALAVILGRKSAGGWAAEAAADSSQIRKPADGRKPRPQTSEAYAASTK